jgi:hypothetical protein
MMEISDAAIKEIRELREADERADERIDYEKFKINEAAYAYANSMTYEPDTFIKWHRLSLFEAFIAGVKWRNGNHE